MDEEVVIVGDDGTEHVFPPGFDPQRAALIVKGQGQGSMPSTMGRIMSGALNDPLAEKPVTLGEMWNDPRGALGRVFTPEHAGGMLRDAALFGVGGAASKIPGARILSAAKGGASQAPGSRIARGMLRGWQAGKPTPTASPAPPVKPVASHSQPPGAVQSPFGGYAGPEVTPTSAAPTAGGQGPLRMAELSAKFGGTAKPKLSAPEVAQMLREQYGSETAGRMLYGKGHGRNILPPAERQAAIKRLAPGESQLPGQARQAIAQKYGDFQKYLAEAPNERARAFILSLMKGD